MLDLGPGDRVTLEPGESLTLEPFVAHAFWAEGGTALAGEISLANDDATDNYFVPPLLPLAPIEEDAPARFVTVREYGRFVRDGASLNAANPCGFLAPDNAAARVTDWRLLE